MKGPVDADRFSGSMKGNLTYGMGPGYFAPWDEWLVFNAVQCGGLNGSSALVL